MELNLRGSFAVNKSTSLGYEPRLYKRYQIIQVFRSVFVLILLINGTYVHA